MKYYVVAGEASGDLHASNLMRAIMDRDPEAQFRFYGGDHMQQAAGSQGVMLRHYKDIAFMGFVTVLLHLRTILRAMRSCRQSIVEWQPNVLILVDYPGFNLKIAKKIKASTSIPIYYYISPKIWAWKEHRIHAIKRDIDEMFSILPFEVDFYKRYSYPIHYVGNPSVDEISEWKKEHQASIQPPTSNLKTIALLPGSRINEIKANLPIMLQAAMPYTQRGYQLVVAGAPNIEDSLYKGLSTSDSQFTVFRGGSFELLSVSEAALVTSGTATLETALLRVPQVVCYYLRVGWFVALLRKLLLKVKYISLVNLIVDRELVPELVASQMTPANLATHLAGIVCGGADREAQLKGYEEMARRLGEAGAPQRAAQIICRQLSQLEK